MHICLDEIRLIVTAAAIALPWLGWLRSWWHHRRRHAGCSDNVPMLSSGDEST